MAEHFVPTWRERPLPDAHPDDFDPIVELEMDVMSVSQAIELFQKRLVTCMRDSHDRGEHPIADVPAWEACLAILEWAAKYARQRGL